MRSTINPSTKLILNFKNFLFSRIFCIMVQSKLTFVLLSGSLWHWVAILTEVILMKKLYKEVFPKESRSFCFYILHTIAEFATLAVKLWKFNIFGKPLPLKKLCNIFTTHHGVMHLVACFLSTGYALTVSIN